MKTPLISLLLLLALPVMAEEESARYIEPPYQEPKVVYDYYLDHPAKMGTALNWLRALVKPLSQPPYNMAPEAMDVVVVLHGTEVATVAKKNHAKYPKVVDRMRYYASLGVEFKVCRFAARELDYELEDLYGFVEVVPSAFAELAYRQQQGYALIVPQVHLRSHSIEELR